MKIPKLLLLTFTILATSIPIELVAPPKKGKPKTTQSRRARRAAQAARKTAEAAATAAAAIAATASKSSALAPAPALATPTTADHKATAAAATLSAMANVTAATALANAAGSRGGYVVRRAATQPTSAAIPVSSMVIETARELLAQGMVNINSDSLAIPNQGIDDL